MTEQTQFDPEEFRAAYFKGDRKRDVREHFEALQKDLDGVPGSVPEIALRYCLSHPAVSTVIPGMRRIQSVESSIGTSDQGPLPRQVLDILHRHAWNKNYYQ